MKKLLFTLVLAVAALSAMAQTDSTATQGAVATSDYDTSNIPAFRNGDKYVVQNKIMDKKEFMNFLQTRDANSYNSFRSAYNTAVAGWSVLGVGIAMDVAGCAVWIAGLATGSSYYRTGRAVSYAGDAVMAAGAVCIAVGYVRMHDAADNYNALQGHRRKSNGVAVALQATGDGLGLALRF